LHSWAPSRWSLCWLPRSFRLTERVSFSSCSQLASLVSSKFRQLYQIGNTSSRSASCILHTPRAHGWHMSRTSTLHQQFFPRHRRRPTTLLNRRMGRAVWAKQYGWSSYTDRSCHVMAESSTSDVPNDIASSTAFHRSFDCLSTEHLPHPPTY
jgi:hypothetical protein